MEAVKEKPIPFGTEALLALLDKRMRETRRIILPQPSPKAEFKHFVSEWGLFECDEEEAMWHIKPKYRPGDVLWVQESWKVANMDPGALTMDLVFKAGNITMAGVCFTPERFDKFRKYAARSGWQSPYFMPREAARIHLNVKDTRAELLNQITEQSAVAEGVTVDVGGMTWRALSRTNLYTCAFTVLWDRLNAKRGYPWERNPWVWVYQFEQVAETERKCE